MEVPLFKESRHDVLCRIGSGTVLWVLSLRPKAQSALDNKLRSPSSAMFVRQPSSQQGCECTAAEAPGLGTTYKRALLPEDDRTA